MTQIPDVELAFIDKVTGKDLRILVEIAGFDPYIMDQGGGLGRNLQRLEPLEARFLAIEHRRGELCEHILGLTTHMVKKLWQSQVEYRAVIRDVAKAMQIDIPNGLPAAEMERMLIQGALNRLRKNASAEELEALAQALEKQFPGKVNDIKAFLKGAGVLAIGNMAGFSLYVGASTVVASLAGAIGLTLPFAAYAAMSSTLAILLGPAGWSALGAAAAYKLGKPNMRTALLTVCEVARLRALQDPGTKLLLPS